MELKKTKFALFLILLLMIVIFILSFYKTNKNIKPLCRDCNVVLIDIDCLRADHLGYFGYERNTSPNIDEFANKSIVFKNFFADGSMTTMSKMSVYTSLYPHVHGVRPRIPILNKSYEIKTKSLDKKFYTVAEILKREGYLTAWVGPIGDTCFPLEFGFGRGFKYFFEEFSYENKSIISDWIKDNKNKKFFISLSSYEVHNPYFPDRKIIKKFTKNETAINIREEIKKRRNEEIVNNPETFFEINFIKENPELFSNKEKLRKSLKKLCLNDSIQIRQCYRITDTDFHTLAESLGKDLLIDLFDAETYEEDQKFKLFFDILDENNLLNNTIIILYSNHGEAFWEHGVWNHGAELYEENIHVPLIIYIPHEQSKEINSLVQGIDILPTLLDLLGVKIPEQAQGRSILPLIKYNQISIREYVISESQYDIFSIRSKDWKYITDFAYGEELYYLKEDPNEKSNTTTIKPNQVNKMRKKLEEHFQFFQEKQKKKNLKIVLITLIILLTFVIITPKKYFKIKVKR